MSPVVGHSAKVMIAERPESPLSNLLSDILVWAGNKYGERPDFGIYNIGGMRASLPQGEVTFGHILEVAPFENGDIVIIHDFDGYPMGRGFINVNSKIRIRLMTRHVDQEIDEEFLRMRVQNAWAYRKTTVDISSCRVIFGVCRKILIKGVIEYVNARFGH